MNKKVPPKQSDEKLYQLSKQELVEIIKRNINVKDGNYNEVIEGNYYEQKGITQISGDYFQYINKNFRSGNLLAVIVAVTPFLIFSLLGGGLGIFLGRQQSSEELQNLQQEIVSFETTSNKQKDEIIRLENLIKEKDKEINELIERINELTGNETSNQCILTINNPLVSLMSEPDSSSRQLIRVNPGNYIPLEHRIIDRGFLGQEAWFQIESQGRKGWIEDNTLTINNKTRICP